LKRPFLLPGLWIFVLLVPLSAADGPVTRAEKAGLTAVARAWASLASWCKTNKVRAEGLAAADAGLRACPGDKKLTGLREDLAALPDEEADEEKKKKYGRERDKACKKIAGTYLKLFAVRPPKDVPARFYGYMVRTVELRPTDKKTWSAYLAAFSKLAAKKEWEGVGALAAGAARVGAPKAVAARFLSLLAKAAQDRPIRLGASAHDMEYFLSLPKGWSPRKKHHLLVTCEGAGSNFLGNHRGFVKRRGDLPLVIITPCTFSTTNALVHKKYNYPRELVDKYQSGPRITFDEEGILCAVRDVTGKFHCFEKFFITGFSGGGNPTYLFVFKHPDKLAGAVPCCANFSGQGLRSAKPPSQGLDMPIHILTGAKDPHREWTHGKVGSPGIEPQTDAAEKLLKERGYTDVRRTMVPGVGHSALPGKVIEFIAEQIKKK
jgi:poly(3-hydroxybutyrate) depolymerase